jgi:hypothetical protein
MPACAAASPICRPPSHAKIRRPKNALYLLAN